MQNAVVRGSGIAAHCCYRLLSAAGFAAALEPSERSSVPAILFGERAQNLFTGVFGSSSLFQGLPRITKRVVAWGPDAPPRTFDHAAVVISEQTLIERLQCESAVEHVAREVHEAWTIFASPPLPAGAAEHRFGTRTAAVAQVNLRRGSAAEACWIESVENGWLFLLPAGSASGWLLAAGGSPDSLISRSRVIAKQVEMPSGPVSQFPAHPRIAWPLCGARWLACGSAALGFDPICGDGTGHALREAILAAAAVRAIAGGEEPECVLLHYRSRLLAGFERHLRLCHEFYSSGRRGPWWDVELEALDRGLAWCRSQAGALPETRFRLAGLELERID